MAEPLLYHLRVHALAEQVRGVAMPQIVEANLGNTGLLQHPPKIPAIKVVSVEWVSVALAEH